MTPWKLSIQELFQRERRYVVPLYQRAYVWSQEEQWEPLWEDVERLAEEQFNTPGADTIRSHFIGAIVLNNVNTGGLISRAEIIDGQQRLTTLQLLLAAIRDCAVAMQSEHANRFRDLTIHGNEKAGSVEWFKVWPTNADRDVFRKVLSSHSPEALAKSLGLEATDELPRIAEAYSYFHACVMKFVGNKGMERATDALEKRFLALFQALKNNLQIVSIELDKQDDPQVIFETLNARGQPLLPSDLIRNFIFLRASHEIEQDVDQLYENYWKAFDNDRNETLVKGESRFWHVQERQGRLLRPRIDLFIFHYLTMKTAGNRQDSEVLNIGQLFREFRDWQELTPMRTEELLADLVKHGSNFRTLMAHKSDDRLSQFASRLKSLDTSVVYPVLLFLMGLGDSKDVEDARNRIVADLESWLIRRMVCQLTNKNYNRFFLSLLTKLKSTANFAEMPSIVRAELSRSKDDTTNWPNDQEFKTGWLNKPAYVKSRPDRTAMILRAVELALRTSKNELVVLPENLTVEHLLPQKGKLVDYPYSSTDLMEKSETELKFRERMINTMGNLTLLTQELNSSVSNGPFAAKSADIRKDSDLRLNAWLRHNEKYESWSEADILQRGERLFESAKTTWPYAPIS